MTHQEPQPKKKKRSPDCPPDIRARKAPEPTFGANLYQPVTSPDRRYEDTNAAKPDDEHVAENRKWVQENKL